MPVKSGSNCNKCSTIYTKSRLNGNKSAPTEHLFSGHLLKFASMGSTNATKPQQLCGTGNQVVSCWVAALQAPGLSVTAFSKSGCNSQARQQVLERLREAVVPPHKEMVVVIWCPALVKILLSHACSTISASCQFLRTSFQLEFMST